MPQYQNAAAVRAQHPGVYDDLSDMQIEQGLAKHATAQPPADETGLAPSPESVLGNFLGMKSPGLGAAGSAIGGVVHELRESVPKLMELSRHGGGVIGPVGSEGVGEAMMTPARHIGRDVAVNTALNFVPTGAKKILKPTGTALTKFGASSAANAPVWKRGIAGAVLEPLLHYLGIAPGIAETAAVVAPPVARATGPMLTRVADALPSTAMEGLAAAAARLKPGIREPFTEATPANVVRETVSTARNLKNGGMSTAQAGQRAGWPLNKSTEVPYRAGSGADFEGARGPDQAAANGHVRALAKLSAGETPVSGVPSKPLSPAQVAIENFYQNDPQARVGGEGRMTGQWNEGNGGLNDIAAGNTDPHLSPSTLDQLSQLSGHALSPADVHAILNKYRNVRVGQ